MSILIWFYASLILDSIYIYTHICVLQVDVCVVCACGNPMGECGDGVGVEVGPSVPPVMWCVM